MGGHQALIAGGLVALVLLMASSRTVGDILGGVSPKIEALAQAIARAEGFGREGQIPTLRNNPGDITDLSGQIKTFPSAADGWQALYDYLGRMAEGSHPAYSPSMTFAQIGLVYAGGDPNWARNVASFLGISPDWTLAEYLEAA